MVAGGDNRLRAAEAGKNAVEQVLAQRGIRRQRAVGIEDCAGGAVVVQQPQLNIFYQQAQAIIQRRLLLFRSDGARQFPQLMQIAGFQVY